MSLTLTLEVPYILMTSPNCTWPVETTLKYSLTHSNTLLETHGTSYQLMSETAIHLDILREIIS